MNRWVEEPLVLLPRTPARQEQVETGAPVERHHRQPMVHARADGRIDPSSHSLTLADLSREDAPLIYVNTASRR